MHHKNMQETRNMIKSSYWKQDFWFWMVIPSLILLIILFSLIGFYYYSLFNPEFACPECLNVGGRINPAGALQIAIPTLIFCYYAAAFLITSYCFKNKTVKYKTIVILLNVATAGVVPFILISYDKAKNYLKLTKKILIFIGGILILAIIQLSITYIAWVILINIFDKTFYLFFTK